MKRVKRNRKLYIKKAIINHLDKYIMMYAFIFMVFCITVLGIAVG